MGCPSDSPSLWSGPNWWFVNFVRPSPISGIELGQVHSMTVTKHHTRNSIPCINCQHWGMIAMEAHMLLPRFPETARGHHPPNGVHDRFHWAKSNLTKGGLPRVLSTPETLSAGHFTRTLSTLKREEEEFQSEKSFSFVPVAGNGSFCRSTGGWPGKAG